jgi:hypothetical protein
MQTSLALPFLVKHHLPILSPRGSLSAKANMSDIEDIDFPDLHCLDGMSDAGSLPSPSPTKSVGSKSTGSEKATPGGALKMCYMPNCQLSQRKGCRWCALHQQHQDNRRYHMEHNLVDGSEHKRVAWMLKMKKDCVGHVMESLF